jgi:hypothetical protein
MANDDRLEMEFPSPDEYLGSGKGAADAFGDYADAVRRFADRLEAVSEAMYGHAGSSVEVHLIGSVPTLVVEGSPELIEEALAIDNGGCQSPVCVDSGRAAGDPDEYDD